MSYMSFRHRRWELAIVVAVTMLILLPVYSVKGIGSQTIRLHLTGESHEETRIRAALIFRKDAEFVLTDPPHPEVKWQDVSTSQSLVVLGLTVVSDTTSSFLICYVKKRYPYADTVAVEYRTPDQPPRFRLTPFEPARSDHEIDVDVSRESPKS